MPRDRYEPIKLTQTTRYAGYEFIPDVLPDVFLTLVTMLNIITHMQAMVSLIPLSVFCF